MKKALKLLELLGDNIEAEEDALAKAFETLLKRYDLSGIRVEAERDGDDFIYFFEDSDGDSEVVVFGIDPDEGVYAIVDSDNDGVLDIDGGMIVDLDTFDPPVREDGSLDMYNLKWLTKSALIAILAPAEIPECLKKELEEKFKVAVRGGQKVRIPIRIKKKIMTSKQTTALAKARRKAHTVSANKTRDMNRKVRTRLGLNK